MTRLGPVRKLGIAALLVAAVAILGHASGSQPDRDAVEAARAELGIPLERRFVDVGDVELHVVLAGPADGAPVVLLHGFPEFWYAWRGPMAHLARAGFRVIVPDQRGYNRSEKPADVQAYALPELVSDVTGLVAALGYDAAHVAGHDWGGGVAWGLVLTHPERVRRLAILDTPHPRAWEGYESEEETISWYRTFIQLPLVPGWTARVANWALLTSSLRGTARPGTFPEPVMDQFRTAWARENAIHSMGAWYRADLPPYAGDGRVALPTLMLVAPDDAYIPGDVTRRSLRFLDDGRLVELEEGSHWVIQEEPELIGGLLAEFFAPG